MIALTAVIDRISRVEEKAVLGKIIGRSLQDELNAMAVKDAKGHTLLGCAAPLRAKDRERGGDEAAGGAGDGLDRCRASGPGPAGAGADREVTNLIETYGPRRDLVGPLRGDGTDQGQTAQAIPRTPLAEACRARWVAVDRQERRGPGAVRYRGDRSHLTEDSLAGAKHVLTILEKQEIEVDPWMLEVQREAWDCELPLFNVCGAEESAEPWNVIQRRKRLKIQETLDQSTAVAGGVCSSSTTATTVGGSTATAGTSGTRAQIT